MSDDAKCVLELFEIHLEMLEDLITDKNVRRDKFDRYSYSSHAINLLLNDLRECTSYKDVSLIRQLIRLHMEMYVTFINDAIRYGKEPHLSFTVAYKAMKYFYALTEGYVE